MSRIYDNKPLSSLPVENHNWGTSWDKQKVKTKDGGAIIEGTIEKRSKHSIHDTVQNKVRYLVLHVKISRAHKRQYDDKGNEVEPNFSETQKVRTGYLHSSYKTEGKGVSDKLTNEETRSLIDSPEITSLTSKHAQPELAALWMEENDSMELENGDSVRVKTYGGGPFIESIAKLDIQSSTVSNYGGGQAVGGSWTDKVMTVKAQDRVAPQENEGVEDDEWDD
ncbi:unnamed protein product [Owenia fusiformis]|uniref:Arpin n=1 Tax=Owenia fusiformis TaxID=6347 RepID=A0A8J1UWQ9_OWEFU|nr:unnamed protein product [Owenia fusiformis]